MPDNDPNRSQGPPRTQVNRPALNSTRAHNVDVDADADLSFDEPPGLTIGRYQILEQLGKGGFGLVYRAEDQLLKRQVAIKVLKRFRSADQVDLWLDEARVLAKLDHPAIVPIYDVGKTDSGGPYIVSKLIEGGTLEDRLRSGAWSIEDSVRVAKQLAQALDYLHSQGVIHRDVKPANILTTPDGNAVLADFGLAMPESAYGRGAHFVGTPAYMSPEQARHEGHRVDGRSDIYSLGVVFYELLTGKRPFQVDDREQLLDCIRSVEVRPVRQIRPSVPRELERICMKALAKKISDRYSSALDIAEDLQLWKLSDTTPSPTLPVPGQEFATGDATAPLTNSSKSIDLDAIAVIPHGLRPFDANDTDFFRFLVPGPRNREGIPEAIRFWTNSIASRKPDQSFQVGVLMGPSGSGKSSLIRAGVIPLIEREVDVVYIEAKPELLEETLSRGIRRVSDRQIADEPDPACMLSRFRESGGAKTKKKLLIVIDQFEQWLNHHRPGTHSSLRDMLRQCDGVHVQALLIVRDDFVLGLSSFMDELEVSMQQNKNFATVEAFGPAHARQVLAAFGRAYGAIRDPMTPSQLAFVEEAIDGLQSQGLINPVQLALLSEMTKGKPWSPATLRELGGIRGLGIAFLDEKLVGNSAHPVLRTHPESVRLLLAEFLPRDNTVIKPPAIQESQLVQILQYAIPAETVRKILHLLDTELRLITPTSSSPTSRNSSTDSSVGDPAYQLAHDYLVPTTREWLALHQSETRSGRVREQLREIASAWNAKPSNKRLPTFLEWLSIRWFTSSGPWSEPERLMMQRSDRRVALNALLLVLGSSLILASALWLIGSNYSDSLAQQLRQADSGQVVDVLKKLDRFRASSLHNFARGPMLTPNAEDEASDKAKLHLALARVEDSPEQLSYVRDHLHEIEGRHLGSILRYLAGKSLGDEAALVETVRNSISLGKPQALPLSALLAQRAPKHQVWDDVAPNIDSLLLNKQGTDLGYWSELFMPVASQLVPGLLEKGKEYRRDNDPMADTCRSMIERFASDDPLALADAMTWSGVEGVKALVDNATSKESQDKLSLEIRNRIKQLTLPPYPALPALASGNEEAAKSNPKNMNSDQHKANALCANYGGRAHGRGGWMDRAPLSAIVSIIDQMRELGYKPWSIRPNAMRQPSNDANESASVAWGLSDEPFEISLDVSSEELKREFDRRKQQGWVMVDFASVPRTDDPRQSKDAPDIEDQTREQRWWGIWRKTSDGSIEDQSLVMDSISDAPEEVADRVPQRVQYRLTSNGSFRFDGLFTSVTKPMRDTLEDRAGDNDCQSRIAVEAGDLYPGVPCSDIRVHEFGSVRYRARLRNDLNYYIQAKQNESLPIAANRQVNLSDTLLDLDDAASALEVLDEIDSASLKSADASAEERVLNSWKRAKGVALAKLSRTEELRRWIAEEVDPSGLAECEKLLLRLRLAVLDQDRDQVARILAAMEPLTAQTSDSAAAMNKGREAMLRAWALVASQSWGREAVAGLMDRLCSRAQQWSANHPELYACTFGSDFDGLQTDATWKSWCFKNRLSAHVSSASWMRLGIDTQADYGLRDSEFQRSAVARLEQGYMPTALEAISDSDGNKLIWCLWERPEIPLTDRAYRAREIANLALGLVFLGQPDQMQFGLQDRWGRSVRTALIDGATRVVEPRILLQWFNESSPSMQVAYLEILGGIPWSAMDPLSQRILQESATRLAEDSVDVRVANTARWCCTTWQLPVPPFPINRRRDPSRNWLTNKLGQQLAVIDIPERVLCGKRGKYRVWKQADRRIAIATTETTGSVFEEFLNDPKTISWIQADPGKRFVKAEQLDDPQCKVSWNLTVRFCQWLNEQEGIPEDQWCYLNVWETSSNAFRFAPNYLERTGYRLPTYAEWKHVCSGGTDETWHFGFDGSMVSLYEWTMPHSGNRRHSVARKRPNASGVFDTGGSLAEWCDDLAPSIRRDRWRSFLVDDGNPVKGVSREDNLTLAGGRFKFTADAAMTDASVVNAPDYSSVSTGFRVARTLNE